MRIAVSEIFATFVSYDTETQLRAYRRHARRRRHQLRIWRYAERQALHREYHYALYGPRPRSLPQHPN